MVVSRVGSGVFDVLRGGRGSGLLGLEFRRGIRHRGPLQILGDCLQVLVMCGLDFWIMVGEEMDIRFITTMILV